MADVELGKEQRRERRDEFEQAYWEGAFFSFVSRRYMEGLTYSSLDRFIARRR